MDSYFYNEIFLTGFTGFYRIHFIIFGFLMKPKIFNPLPAEIYII